ncbi:hypothetical protein Tco_0186411 [Tanacetum coccineum]
MACNGTGGGGLKVALGFDGGVLVGGASTQPPRSEDQTRSDTMLDNENPGSTYPLRGWIDPPMCNLVVAIILGLLRGRNRLEAQLLEAEMARKWMKKMLVIAWCHTPSATNELARNFQGGFWWDKYGVCRQSGKERGTLLEYFGG